MSKLDDRRQKSHTQTAALTLRFVGDCLQTVYQ